MATPPPFDGKRENVQGFIDACKMYIMINQDQFGTEEVTMTWILGYMQTGSALQYRQAILRDMESAPLQEN